MAFTGKPPLLRITWQGIHFLRNVSACRNSGILRCTDGEILRIIYESLSQTFAETAENISQLTGKKYECIHIFGGGCRDTLLCELTEKKSGMKVFRGPAEATAAGNAICALIALGDTESISQARKMTAYIDK